MGLHLRPRVQEFMSIWPPLLWSVYQAFGVDFAYAKLTWPKGILLLGYAECDLLHCYE